MHGSLSSAHICKIGVVPRTLSSTQVLCRKQMSAGAGTSLLEQERDRLKCALGHLERSVTELKAAVADSGPDPDYKEAITENITVIAKYRARVAALEEEIQHIKGLKGNGSVQQLATVPVVDDPVYSQQQPSIRQQPELASQQQQQQQHLQHQQTFDTTGGARCAAQTSTTTAAAQADAVQSGGMWL